MAVIGGFKHTGADVLAAEADFLQNEENNTFIGVLSHRRAQATDPELTDVITTLRNMIREVPHHIFAGDTEEDY